MTTFNYKKWVTDYKQGKPLFEQTTGSYTGSYSTGSFTGSYSTGSYTGSSSTGSSSTGSYHQEATGSSVIIPQIVNVLQTYFGNMQITLLIISNQSCTTYQYNKSKQPSCELLQLAIKCHQMVMQIGQITQHYPETLIIKLEQIANT
jgi:hypothetical protein